MKEMNYVTRWLLSTSHKDIGILYLIFGMLSAMVATGMSVIIRMELSNGNSTMLFENNQVFNGAPSNSFLTLLTSFYFMICLTTIILCFIFIYHFIYGINLINLKGNIYRYYCVKYCTYLLGANSRGKIACTKTGLKEYSGTTFYMARLTNLLQGCYGVWLPRLHSEEDYSHLWFYVKVICDTILNNKHISNMSQLRGLNKTCVRTKNSGSPEIRKYWGDGTLVVSIIHYREFSSYNYKLIEKGRRIDSSKEALPEGLAKLEQLMKNNIENNKLINFNIINIIKDINILKLAYGNIKSKPGNMTKGVSNETLDGIDNKYFDNLSKDLGRGSFKFTPVRRIEIPKEKGGTRPLSIGTPREKIVQEAIRMVLNAIFEPSMHDKSHGFRPNKGCQSAIWDVRNLFGSVNWFIELDISKCFDTIPHNLIINQLKQRIDDWAFISLIYKLLRAGYVDSNGTYFNTKIGTPQGAIVSPILCNIVLDLLDKYIDELISKFNIGDRRKMNPVYLKLSRSISAEGLLSNRKKLRTPILNGEIRAHIANDPNYKRMKFVRYADDVLIGVIGSKKDCMDIKNHIKIFLDTLGLKMNEDKTLITHANSDYAKFLGYHISITPAHKRPILNKTMHNKNMKALSITRPILNAPIKDIVFKLGKLGYCKRGQTGTPTGVGRLIHEEIRTIINMYLRTARGILGYYKLATNYRKLKERLFYIMFYSCVLTIARKMKLKTMKNTIKKYGIRLTQYKLDKKGNKIIDIEFTKETFESNIKKVKSHLDYINSTPSHLEDPLDFIDKAAYMLPRTKAVLDKNCMICNSNENVEMHHVRQIKDIKPKDYITGRMVKINRKQIPLCKICHIKHHMQKNKNEGPGI